MGACQEVGQIHPRWEMLSSLGKWDLKGLELEEKGQEGDRCVGQDADIGITGVLGASK